MEAIATRRRRYDRTLSGSLLGTVAISLSVPVAAVAETRDVSAIESDPMRAAWIGGVQVGADEVVSPKLSLRARASDAIGFFASAGVGIRPKSVYSVAGGDAGGSPPRAFGGQMGAAFTPHHRVRISTDLWYLGFASENREHPAGVEPTATSGLFGVDLDATVDLTAWLAVDASMTWASPAAASNADDVSAQPHARRWTSSGAVRAHQAGGLVTLRARGLADRTTSGDGASVQVTRPIFDLIATKLFDDNFAVELAVTNVFDSAWHEGQLADGARATTSGDLMDQLRYAPGAPLTAMLTASYTY